jgi:hypothetical protein
VRVVYDWTGAFDKRLRAARRPHAPEEPRFQFVRADYVAHEQIVCPIISGLVGLPRLVLLYLDTGLAYGKVLLSVAQD